MSQVKYIQQPHLLRTFTPNIQQLRITNQHRQRPRPEIGLQIRTSNHLGRQQRYRVD
jgi:hypothetical protein